ncbi:5-methyltetrahydropteroyltriglutamate- homocysteine methyltransferase [Haemophilus haemolyticus M21621]|nr:5-methyltetrahydropteroyltriglutamate- homocysteine methyltransferase [Haemophilus haemolyticus M21621]EGT80567.1 5-methyltetrahydropteroyltriglutamate- homocysteine methyltransferase [Haemophilus haemolyticus M21621]
MKPFTTSLLGSMPRSQALLMARKKHALGKITTAELEQIVVQETKQIVELQQRTGIDIITSGELLRDNYLSFIAQKIQGATLMSMSEMLDHIKEKQIFESMLETLDVPALSIKNAICVGKISYKQSLVADEMLLLKNLTKQPIKATLPGPYLMARSMWLSPVSGQHYSSKEEMAKDVVTILKQEIDHLCELGVSVVQFDEPVLTEVIFSHHQTRSFMCAALSEKQDFAAELQFAKSLITQIFEYARNKNIKTALHVCRGNWSKDESVLLRGPYTSLVDLFESALPDILMLEFSTPRAGELSSLLESKILRQKCILGLGVINPRSDEVETVDQIIQRAEKALNYLPPEQIWLNPDCGFATFSNRPLNGFDIIEAKLKVLNEAKSILRERYVSRT